MTTALLADAARIGFWSMVIWLTPPAMFLARFALYYLDRVDGQ